MSFFGWICLLPTFLSPLLGICLPPPTPPPFNFLKKHMLMPESPGGWWALLDSICFEFGGLATLTQAWGLTGMSEWLLWLRNEVHPVYFRTFVFLFIRNTPKRANKGLFLESWRNWRIIRISGHCRRFGKISAQRKDIQRTRSYIFVFLSLHKKRLPC